MNGDIVQTEALIRQFLRTRSHSKRNVDRGKKLLLEIRARGRTIAEPGLRRRLAENARVVGDRLWDLTGEYYPIHLDPLNEELEGNQTSTRDIGEISPTDTAPKVPIACPPPRAAHLIGRDSVITRIVDALTNGKSSIAVTGLAGVGKTDLLRAVGRDAHVQVAFPRAVLYAELGQNPHLPDILRSWIAVIQAAVPEGDDVAVLTAELKTHLYNGAALLVIDDVWDSSIEAAILLRDCSGDNCRVLASSRNSQVAREVVRDGAVINLDVLDTASAFDLLHYHAPDQVDAEREAAQALVTALGNLPLAVKLAGNYIRNDRHHSNPCAALLESWQQNLDKLKGYEFRPDIEPEQTSLSEILGLSYYALPDESVQRAADALGAFGVRPLDWDWDAMLALWQANRTQAEEWELLLVASGLIDFNYHQRRYSMHPTIAAFLGQRTSEQTRRLHATYYLKLAKQALQKLQAGDQEEPIRLVTIEYLNLLTALDWSVSNAPEIAIMLGSTIWPYWNLKRYFTEGRQQLDRLLGQSHHLEYLTAERAEVLHGTGTLAYFQGDLQQAHAYLTESLVIRQQLEETRGMARTSNNLGLVAQELGDYKQAVAYFSDAYRLFTELNETYAIAVALGNLGRAELELRITDKAQQHLETSLSMLTKLESVYDIATFLPNLGSVYIWKGDRTRARHVLEEGLDLSRRLDDPYIQAIALSFLGWLDLDERRTESARQHLTQSLLKFVNQGDQSGIAACLEDLAGVVALTGDQIKAVKLFSAADKLSATSGRRRLLIAQEPYEQRMTEIRNQLGETRFTQAWEEGRSMGVEQAIQEALIS